MAARRIPGWNGNLAAPGVSWLTDSHTLIKSSALTAKDRKSLSLSPTKAQALSINRPERVLTRKNIAFLLDGFKGQDWREASASHTANNAEMGIDSVHGFMVVDAEKFMLVRRLLPAAFTLRMSENPHQPLAFYKGKTMVALVSPLGRGDSRRWER